MLGVPVRPFCKNLSIFSSISVPLNVTNSLLAPAVDFHASMSPFSCLSKIRGPSC